MNDNMQKYLEKAEVLIEALPISNVLTVRSLL